MKATFAMLNNKIDFVALISVDRANANGDPLNGNRPRTDYSGFGEMSDVCIKRKIRNRMQDLGQSINNRILSPEDFIQEESGAVRMTDQGRQKFLKQWQLKKQESITHPYLEEKIPWGLVPYVQALLLARYLREDMDGYPPFLWK